MLVLNRSSILSVPFVGVAIGCLALAIANGQVQRLKTIRVRVIMPDGSPAQTVKVRIEGSEGETVRDGFTDSNGSIEAPNLRVGPYTVTVPSNGQSYETSTERIDVNRVSPDVTVVTINLNPGDDASKRRKGERPVVSAGESEGSVPTKAREAYNRASRFAKENKPLEAIRELERALEIYPRYLQACNDLGVAFMKLDRVEEAVRILTRAAAIDPKAFNPRLNLGIARVRGRDFAAAEPDLRAAISLDASSPLAHMYLGVALAKTERGGKAEEELLRAISLGESDVAIAHYYLGELYASHDRTSEAIAELEAYLKQQPDSSDASRVRQEIARLRSHQKRI